MIIESGACPAAECNGGADYIEGGFFVSLPSLPQVAQWARFAKARANAGICVVGDIAFVVAFVRPWRLRGMIQYCAGAAQRRGAMELPGCC